MHLPVIERALGEVSLVLDGEHFDRVVCQGIARARTSIDIMTADFKSMLVPDGVASARSRISPAHSPHSRGTRSGRWSGSGQFHRKAKSIVSVFRELAERGVEIRLLHAGTPSSAALRELKQELPAGLTIRRCPRLHAKTVIVDSRWLYLGSANLTGAGLGAKGDGKRNFEMGVCTESASLIDGVSEQFNALWEGRRCKNCRRKEVCPVPLEEPRLQGK